MSHVDELIEEIDKTPVDVMFGASRQRFIKNKLVIIQSEQEALQKKADAYDELSKPVEIPQFVAQWIEDHKKKDLNFYTSVSSMTTGDVDDWYLDNEDIYAKAWYFGYTVQQEQLYYIELPGSGYLGEVKESGYFERTIHQKFAKKFTESGIKAIDECYWPFAVKVEEQK